jgi:hypothetical protein
MSKQTQKKIRDEVNVFYNIKNIKINDLIKLARNEGVDLGKRKETQIKRTYEYFGEITNDLINRRNKKQKLIKQLKPITTEIKNNYINAYEQIKNAYKNKNAIQMKVFSNNDIVRDLNYDFRNDFNIVKDIITTEKGKTEMKKINVNSNWSNVWALIRHDLQPETDKNIFDIYPNVRMFVIEGFKPIKSASVQTAFFDGKINCVMSPIIKFIENKIDDSKTKKTIDNYRTMLKKALNFEKKYHNVGVNNEALNEISNDLQIDLIVHLPFQKDYIIAKSNVKALRTFNYINSRINHVEFDELTHNDEEKILTLTELKTLQIKLDHNKIYNTYKKNNLNICEINTATTRYKLSNEYKDAKLEMEIQSGLIDCKLCDIKDADISRFVRQGTHFNETIDFNIEETKYNHIDMRRAYLNYRMSKYYKGFVGKITDFRKCDKIIDVGYYQIINLILSGRIAKWNEKLNCYNDNIYPSVELEMLKEEGCTFDIIAGCWGSIIDFDFTDDMLNKVEILDDNDKTKNIRFYCKFIGSMYCMNMNHSYYMKADNDFINHLHNEIDADFLQFNNEIKVSYPKKNNYHLSHVCGFILSYMRMNMLEQLYEFEPNEICKIVVDGIYHTKKDVELKNCFRVEEKEMTTNIGGRSYISNNTNQQIFTFADFKDHHLIEVHKGAGGSGKTHKQLTDLGYVNIQYFAPSWKLARTKQNEYNVRCDTIAKITSDDPAMYNKIKQYCNVLVVDECSMLSNENKDKIIKNFKGCKILFCGDFGFQLPAIEGSPFNIKNMYVIEHTTNYRVKCDKLAIVLKDIRKMIMNGINPRDYVLKTFSKIDNMDYDYLKDMILCSSHINKNVYTDKYMHLNKYYILKSDRIYGRGEIYYELPKTKEYEIRHAFTIHSIQGETAKGNVFFEIANIYNPQMIYTAISRAEYFHQIKLI